MNELPKKNIFLSKYGISEESFAETGLVWEDLENIHSHFLAIQKDIDIAGKSILERLLSIENVHSVRYRIKNSEHLIEKIIRKRKLDKARIINKENYLSEITDLIGLRIIHIYKSDWTPIHRGLTEIYNAEETPIVYFRTGDNPEYLKEFKDAGIEAREHPSGYRSIHYTVKTKPARQEYFAEIQVRTIFEEGWSEIDHDVRYPYEADNILYSTISSILNRLAGSADELAMFIVAMRASIIENREEVARLKKEIDKSNLGVKEKEVIKAGISGSGAFNELFRQHLETISRNNIARIANFSPPPSAMQTLLQSAAAPILANSSLENFTRLASMVNQINTPLSKLNIPSTMNNLDVDDKKTENDTIVQNEEEASQGDKNESTQ